MRTGQHNSKPVLTFAAGVLALTVLIFGFGVLYHRHRQSEAVIPLPQPEAGATADTNAPEPPPTTLADAGLPPVVPISLTNVLIDAENGSWLRDQDYLRAPHHPRDFGGIEFLMDGMLQLQSRVSKDWKKRSYRTTVVLPLALTNLTDKGVEILERGSNVASLHLLGGTRYGYNEEKIFAEIVWRYTDGSALRTPIQYQSHFRDWIRNPYEQPAHLPYPFAKAVWAVPLSGHPGYALRLYRTSFANPAPQKIIRQLEFASAMEDPTLFIVGVTLDPLAPGQRPDDSADQEPADPGPPKQIQILVQSAETQPLPGARLQVQMQQTSEGKGFLSSYSLTTDAAGSAMVSYPPQDMESLEVDAAFADYGDGAKTWDLTAGDTVPTTYTFKLGAGANIGGIVVDESNSPIAGARIQLAYLGGQADFPSQTLTTDAQGQWWARRLPIEKLSHIYFGVNHPDFISTNFTVSGNGAMKNELHAGTLKIILPRGLVVHGLVTDENDNPVPGAAVSANQPFRDVQQQMQTGANGQFRFSRISQGNLQFSVMAKGHSPLVKTIPITPGMAEIVLKLERGKTISVLVQNEAGEPLPGVRASPSSVFNSGEVRPPYAYEATTDSQGRFVWDGAPDEPVRFDFIKSGYEPKSDQVLKPEVENVVTLRKPRILQGQVLDDDTGKPITNFRLGVGRFQGMALSLFGADMKDYTDENGMFTATLNRESDDGVQAEADDHARKAEVLPAAENGEVQIILRLKPSADLHGIVTAPNGTPLPGVSVAIARDGEVDLYLQGGHFRPPVSGEKASIVSTTDANGGFILPHPPETGGTVVAVGDLGFASASVEQVRANPTLVLQPFGRIEGTVKSGGQPAAGCDLVYRSDIPGIETDFNGYKSTTDGKGKFSFEKVPPGKGAIARIFKYSPTSFTYSDPTPVSVQPGQTTQITLGDSGAVLKGTARLETPPADGEVPNIEGRLYSPEPSRPAFNSTAEAQAYFNTPEYMALKNQQKIYPFMVGTNGTFSVENVVPGIYTLSVVAGKGGTQSWPPKTFAQSETTITVPSDASPLSPINLGEIVLKPAPTQ